MAPGNPVGGVVLIIDDDYSVTDTWGRMLMLEGYTVDKANSSDEGLAAVRHRRPDAILLDLRMPLVSGLEFLRALRAEPGCDNVPVAIVTGDYYLDEMQATELRTLAATLRYKPLWLEDLLSLAHELVAGRGRGAVGGARSAAEQLQQTA